MVQVAEVTFASPGTCLMVTAYEDDRGNLVESMLGRAEPIRMPYGVGFRNANFRIIEGGVFAPSDLIIFSLGVFVFSTLWNI